MRLDRSPVRRQLLSIGLAVALLCTGLGLGAYWFGPSPPSPQRLFWVDFFNRNQDAYLVPADSGLSIYQDLTEHLVPLPDYIQGGYRDPSLPGDRISTAVRLGARPYTSIGDLRIATALARLPEIVPRRYHVRSARDLRLDDLKQGNVILLGSIASDPWVDLFLQKLNFRFTVDPGSHRYFIQNIHPRAGEQALYQTDPGDPAHPTYGLIAVERNLSGSGYVLMLGGLNSVGTEAAADFLMSKDSLPLLRSVLCRDGSIRIFEALVATTNIDAGSPSSHIVAERIAGLPSR